MMTSGLFLMYLLSIVPSSLAFRMGAPPDACSDLMPRHGVQSARYNDGFFLLGDVFNGSYIPGRTYESENIYLLSKTYQYTQSAWRGLAGISYSLYTHLNFLPTCNQ